MDSYFSVRALIAALNKLRSPSSRIYNRYFRGKLNWKATDRFALDILTGSETVLKAIQVIDPMPVGTKTTRSGLTVVAPRIGEKRFLAAADFVNERAFGEEFAVKAMKQQLGIELLDMRNKIERTLEFWAAYVLRGNILDSDLTTVLVDYNMAVAHKPVLAGNDLWSDTTNSNPITKIREWKKLIADDSGHSITGWYAYCGSSVMDALINHPKLTNLLTFERGRQIVEEGAIVRVAGVTIEEYLGSFLDSTATRKRYVEDKDFILIAEGNDVFDCPYCSVVEENVDGRLQAANGRQFFSKSWVEQDPSGRWVKAETRVLPYLKRPEAIIRATVLA